MFDGVGAVIYMAVWVFILYMTRMISKYKNLPLNTPQRKLAFPIVVGGVLPFFLILASKEPWVAVVVLVFYAVVFGIVAELASDYFDAHPFNRDVPPASPASLNEPDPFQDIEVKILDELERTQLDKGRVIPQRFKDQFRDIIKIIVEDDFKDKPHKRFTTSFDSSKRSHYEGAFARAFTDFLNEYLPRRSGAGIFMEPMYQAMRVGYSVSRVLEHTAWNAHLGCFENLHKTVLDNYWGVTRSLLTEKQIAEKGRITPTNYPGDPAEIPKRYLANTPLLPLYEGFEYEIAFVRPFTPQHRLEHMFILAPSGTGKTQLMQGMIAEDLELVKKGEASVIVIDSQGINRRDTSKPTMVENIINLEVFATDLKDKLTYVKPSMDLAFNIFDMGQNNPNLTDQQRSFRRTAARNIILTSIAAGSDLQYRMLSRCIELAMLADAPTVRTLRRIITTDAREFPKQFAGLLKRADEDTQDYFKTAFFGGSNTTVKEALVTRLEGLSAEPMFRAMLSKPHNDFYMIDEIEAGRVVVIDADKVLLGEHGAEAFGRFFIAQLLYASRQRQSTKPVYLYVDEVHDFVSNDENITTLLHQARKQDIGLVLATSGLHLINSAKVKQSLQEVAIRMEHEKGKPRGTFNLHLRENKEPIEVLVKPNVMEELPRVTPEQYAEVHRPKASPPPQLIPQVLKKANNDDDDVI